MAATSVTWLTLSNSADSTRTPLNSSFLAIATVLRSALTTLSLVGANSSAGGERFDACTSGWLSGGVFGHSNATWVFLSPMGKKS
jgi:hypothetical protein